MAKTDCVVRTQLGYPRQRTQRESTKPHRKAKTPGPRAGVLLCSPSPATGRAADAQSCRRNAHPAVLSASSPRSAPPAPGPSPSRPASPPPSPTSSSRTMAASRSILPRPPSAAPPLRLRLCLPHPPPPRHRCPRRLSLRLHRRPPTQSHRRIGPGPTIHQPSPHAAAKAAALARAWAWASSQSAAWWRPSHSS
jgi:hypothetical protein